jgi:hypothetical protein
MNSQHFLVHAVVAYFFIDVPFSFFSVIPDCVTFFQLKLKRLGNVLGQSLILYLTVIFYMLAFVCTM